MHRGFPERNTGTRSGKPLDELAELAESAGGNVVGSILQLRDRPDPATLVGRGKLEEIEAEAQLRTGYRWLFSTAT